RDNQAAFEAFKKNLVDTRIEADPNKWAQGYDFDAVKSGKVILDTIETRLPKPTSAFVFNTRREIFADPLVREALDNVFDFEWANKNLFHGLFRRTQGYYTGSDLSSIGHPANDIEKSLLKSVGANLQQRFLDGSFRQPVSDGSGRDRKRLRQAVTLLAKAGWKFKNRVLTNTKTGKPFAFEIVVQNPEQEKIALHLQRSLRQIGIAMTIRQVDSSQFQQRLQTYDYDMIPFTWDNSLSPGNEQAFYWGSKGRTQPGTRNYMGVADPAIDKLIDEMVKAPSGEAFIASVRALDRVLVSGFYVIPLYHANGQWLARWSQIKYAPTTSNYGFRAEAAWYQAP
ncbi:MAG TPA: ABC transporter substrate-binding protein, partial [Rhizobiales bacterium]|nr:ABC transporter substrate-binding protein [Hyphomicrobiales bacterium]